MVAALLISGLALTNPGADDYAAWTKLQLVKRGGVQGLVGGLLPASVITRSTLRTNFLVLSVYETRIGDAYTARSIGVLNHFFALNADEQRS